MSGTRSVRSASQPNIGSLTSRAAGHAAMTTPSVARSMPCSTKYSGSTGSRPPKPSHTMNSAMSSGRIGPQWSSHVRNRIGRRERRGGVVVMSFGQVIGCWPISVARAIRRASRRSVRCASRPRRHGPGVYSGLPTNHEGVPPRGRHHGRGPGQDLQDPQIQVRALDGVDLTVAEGTVLGLLGPNGAGKTTTVRILATLLRPDAGHATVAGFDVVRQAQQIRSVIGLSGQYAAVDENLTGRENLWMFGRLYQLHERRRAPARRRAARAVRPGRCGGPHGQDLLGRHAPPARPRQRAHRPAAPAVPRRADDRPRSRAAASGCGTSSGRSCARARRSC